MSARKALIACAATAVASLLVAGLLVAGSDGAKLPEHLSATPQEQRFYMLTATLKPRFVTNRPVGTSAETVGRFSAQFDRNFREEGGHALYPRLRFTGLTGPATAVHIHLGRAGASGRELTRLCGPNISPAPTCKSPLRYFWWGAWMLEPVLTGPAYVDVHTKRNPDGELRGQLRVVPIERRK